MEECSYTTITAGRGPPCFPNLIAASSPLWLLPSEPPSTTHVRRSFSLAHSPFGRGDHHLGPTTLTSAGDNEERMDMLWEEYFNEELNERPFWTVSERPRRRHAAAVEVRVSRSGRVVLRRKHHLVEVLDVLKRLFHVHRIHSERKEGRGQ